MAVQAPAVTRLPDSLHWCLSRRQVMGALFVLGVITQNVQLLPVNSEYQPWIYCGVIPFALWTAYHNRVRVRTSLLLPSLMLCGALLALLVLAVVKAQMLPAKDLVRVLALPAVAAASALYLREVPAPAVRLLLYVHGLMLVLGVIAPAAATAISAQFASRGQEYYLGWNSYFSSEPSYAALTFLFLAFFLVRESRLSVGHAVLLGALLGSTMSVTGIFGAIIIGSTLLWQRSKLALFASCCLVLVVSFSISVIPRDSTNRSLQRLSGLGAAIDEIGGSDYRSMLLIINAAEPSGTWRIYSNIYALSCTSDLPFGLGTTDIFGPIARSECSEFLAAVLRLNETFKRLGPGASAQSVFANLSLLSGLPGLMMGLALVGLQLAAFRHRYVRQAMPLSMCFIGFFLIWQSAWAAPTASLMIAAAYPLKARLDANARGEPDAPG